MAIPLFCLNLIVVAGNNLSDLDIFGKRQIYGGGRIGVTSTNQNTRKITGTVKDANGDEVIGASVVEVELPMVLSLT